MFTFADESLAPGSSLLLLNGPPWRLVPHLPAFRPASFILPYPSTASNLDRWPRLETRGRKSMAHNDYVLPPSWANPVAFTSTVSYGS